MRYMDKEYASCLSRFWLLHDASDDARLERLKFHLEQGDYFPFLATVVGFLKETAESCAPDSEMAKTIAQQAAFAEEVRKDLIYLHENYQLAPKEKPITYSPKKMVRF